MNFRFILLFSIVTTVVSILLVALVTFIVFKMYEPNDADTNVLTIVTAFSSFCFSFICFVLLPYIHPKMPYEHSAMVTVFSFIYTLIGDFVFGAHENIPIHMYILSKVIPVYLTVAAIIFGVPLGLKLRQILCEKEKI